MKEYNLNEVELEEPKALAKVTIWTKISRALFQEVKLKPIVLELTPTQETVLTEVHDFLFQEVKFSKIHDFFFQDVHLFGKKNKEKM